ncbi:MAG: hypothetical protein JST50_01505 [Bacteroidetes bacterium]|jgi:hypothetical protein|nr:hypothetical protein [Bacteroidota bacterium]
MSRKTVTFQITFTGGAGTIDLTGIDGSGDQTFTSDGSFTANQSTGDQHVIAGGVAPAGGKITVKISCDGKELKSQDFNGQFDAQEIDYDVPDDDTAAMALSVKNPKAKRPKAKKAASAKGKKK